jgi:hypothetical protein
MRPISYRIGSKVKPNINSVEVHPVDIHPVDFALTPGGCWFTVAWLEDLTDFGKCLPAHKCPVTLPFPYTLNLKSQCSSSSKLTQKDYLWETVMDYKVVFTTMGKTLWHFGPMSLCHIIVSLWRFYDGMACIWLVTYLHKRTSVQNGNIIKPWKFSL